MIDEVRFCVPLGRVAEAVVLRSYLRQILADRYASLKADLERR